MLGYYINPTRLLTPITRGILGVDLKCCLAHELINHLQQRQREIF